MISTGTANGIRKAGHFPLQNPVLSVQSPLDNYLKFAAIPTACQLTEKEHLTSPFS